MFYGSASNNLSLFQSSDFFLYTALMVADMLLFGFMAYRYKYVTREEDEDKELKEQENETKISRGIENPSFNDPPKELMTEKL